MKDNILGELSNVFSKGELCKFLYNAFKIFFVTNVISVKSFDQISNISNELEFFFTTFDNCSISGLDMFFKN